MDGLFRPSEASQSVILSFPALPSGYHSSPPSSLAWDYLPGVLWWVGRRGGPGGSVKLEDPRAPLSLLVWVSLVKLKIIELSCRGQVPILWLKMLDACQFCGSKCLDSKERPTILGRPKFAPLFGRLYCTVPNTFRLTV